MPPVPSPRRCPFRFWSRIVGNPAGVPLCFLGFPLLLHWAACTHAHASARSACSSPAPLSDSVLTRVRFCFFAGSKCMLNRRFRRFWFFFGGFFGVLVTGCRHRVARARAGAVRVVHARGRARLSHRQPAGRRLAPGRVLRHGLRHVRGVLAQPAQQAPRHAAEGGSRCGSRHAPTGHVRANFDIGVDHFSRIPQLYSAPHALPSSDVPCVVPCTCVSDVDRS